jgi:hypothetical protein
MKRGPKVGLKTERDFVAKAKEAWGSALPDWVHELAVFASQTSQRTAAERIGYSAAVVSHVFANSYNNGDLGRVEEKVRGALMGLTVVCPVYGDIGRDRCLDIQKQPFAATSSVRARVYWACRKGCPHSRITQEGGGC